MIRSILISPNDDLPRLIYADWLDENGQSDRAAFIRVQIDIANGDISQKSKDLEHRLWMLDSNRLAIHKYNLRFNLSAVCTVIDQWYSPNHVIFTVRRGLVEEISCKQTDWVGMPCSECNGTGINNGEGNFTQICLICKGKKRFNIFAERVGAIWPITKVIINDAVIQSSMGSNHFYLGGLGSFPRKYWGVLDRHDSRLSVRNTLVKVCVAHMRELVNLPPLDGFTF